ncbi:hypothetical protein NP493_1269g00039 [Ridgeia piscesae]|uniref:C-CAP/cofactor C-like domain-containing protein n=1 Tax=Ridgeia piscesae TaxID=27915 RepID=A0AAD9NGP6_RIDPI|nr:hypothetical protein NP493_1269g00039 [Ridgeia piscesae]
MLRMEDTSKAGGEADARSALFADLNKGGSVTSGLKKVTNDMKTHKNPALRLTTAQPYKPSAAAQVSAKTVKSFGSGGDSKPPKPAKCALEGKKWVVEHQHGNKNVVISDTNQKQTVYIFNCDNSTIQVKGKLNSISLDNCKKTGLVFEDVISAIDVVNCKSVQIQVLGKVPTINVDKTDGCMMYLSKDSLKTEIVSAKSSEMNVLIPDASGQFKEYVIPEQFKTTFDGKKLNTSPSDIAG